MDPKCGTMCGVETPELDSKDFDLSNEDEVKPMVLLALNSDIGEPSKQDNVTNICVYSKQTTLVL